jgi:hypothetical protein
MTAYGPTTYAVVATTTVKKISSPTRKFAVIASTTVNKLGARGKILHLIANTITVRSYSTSVPPDFVDPPAGFTRFGFNAVSRFTLYAYERFFLSTKGDI